MSLQDINLPSFLDTSGSDLIGDFFIPVLERSERYDRGVGFFSSGWLRIAAKGMAEFSKNGGVTRWVTSPDYQKKIGMLYKWEMKLELTLLYVQR